MSFLETPRFPLPPGVGYRSLPMYSTGKVERAGGHEQRNRNWAYPLHEFEGEIEHAEEDIAAVLEFYHAVAGEWAGFRFKDWNDFKSCRGHLTPAATDQPLPQISGLTYQLVKRYVAGSLITERIIQKPVSGTILVADNGTPLTAGSQYTVDTATGIVTLAGSPTGPVTWGGEFDVPVRFEGRIAPEISFRDDTGTAVQRLEFRLVERRL